LNFRTWRSGLENIVEGNFENGTNLRELVIESYELSPLPRDAFKSLDNLVTLAIRHGKLEQITRGVFPDLRKLQSLWLQNCSIKSIDKNAFEDLENLKSIVLEYNQLVEIPGKLFQPLVNLRELYLYSNNLQRLEDDWFNENGANIEFLSFRFNNISAVSPNFIRNLPQLNNFGMQGNICSDRNVLKSDFPQNFTAELHSSLQTCYENFGEFPTTEDPDIEDARRFLMEFKGFFRIVDDSGKEVVKKNVEEVFRF
jgi:hypothetical protein